MSDAAMRELRTGLAGKSTDELQAIWAARDSDEWRPEAVEVARQLLRERGAVVDPGAPAGAPAASTGQRVPYRMIAAFVGAAAGSVVGVAGRSPDSLLPPWLSVVGPAVTWAILGALLGGVIQRIRERRSRPRP